MNHSHPVISDRSFSVIKKKQFRSFSPIVYKAKVPRSKEGGEGRCRGQFSSAKYGI